MSEETEGLHNNESSSDEMPLDAKAEEITDCDLRFGWGRFRPQCLQVLNNPKCFIAALSFVSFIQGMTVNGFTNLYLLTLEKRFQLTSIEVGFVAASNDVAGILITALVSFYGTYRNKIKFLGYGSLLTGLGCLFFGLPQLLVGRYEPVIPGSSEILNGEVCRVAISGTTEVCFANYGAKWYYIFIFFMAQLLMGAGATPLFTLGPAYLDENVHPKSSPIYLAVFFACTLLGPGLGFISGGTLLNIYVDITQPEGSNMSPEDPRWIGAWWLGYLVGGSFLCFASVLFLGFPHELPGAKSIRERALKDGYVPKEDERLRGKLKDFLPATAQLLRSAVFVFNTLAITTSSLFGAGIASFIAKILQLKFNLSPFITGIVIGVIMVLGVVGGVLVGGFIVRRFDLKRSLKMAARFCVIASVFTIIGCTSWFIPGCNTPNLAGVTAPYSNSSSMEKGVKFTCNLNCSCSMATMIPVCGEDGLNYFSPCHAGCKNVKNGQEFANCSCINPPGNATEGSAAKGYCGLGSGCKNYIPFLLLTIVVLFSVFITAIANKTVVLRCVPYNQRAYALGLQFILQRSIGFLPGPLFFGAIFDEFCLLWGESCGKKGNCQFYEMNALTNRLGIFGICFTGVSFVFYFLSFWFCKPTIQEEEETMKTQSAKNDDQEHVTLESSI